MLPEEIINIYKKSINETVIDSNGYDRKNIRIEDLLAKED